MERPRVWVNMVMTLDGRTTIGGRSSPIGGEADRRRFHALREQADAVLAGTGTLRAERYGRMIPDPERRARREAAGRAGDALAVVVSRSGDVPWDIPLFEDTAVQPVAVFGIAAGPVPALYDPDAELDHVLERLAAGGVGTLLCEGGATMNRALLDLDAVDEIYVTLAPKFAGGDGPTAVAGAEFDPPVNLRLESVEQEGGEVFLRYCRAP